MTNSIQRTNPLDLPIPHPTVGRLTLLSHRKIGSCDQPGRFNQAGCLGAPCHSSAQVQRVLLLHPRRAQLHGLRGLGGRVVVPPEVLGVRRSPSGLSLRVVLGVRRPSGFAWISSGCLLHWAFASALLPGHCVPVPMRDRSGSGSCRHDRGRPFRGTSSVPERMRSRCFLWSGLEALAESSFVVRASENRQPGSVDQTVREAPLYLLILAVNRSAEYSTGCCSKKRCRPDFCAKTLPHLIDAACSHGQIL